MFFAEVFDNADVAYQIVHSDYEAQMSVYERDGKKAWDGMGCRTEQDKITHNQSPTNRRLQRLGNLLRILAHTPLPCPNRLKRITQTLLSSMSDWRIR